MTYLRFADQHVPDVRSGDKRYTVRVGLDGRIEQRQSIRLLDESDDEFATARVDSLVKTDVRGAHLLLPDGYDKPRSPERLATRLERYYDRSVDVTTDVTVVRLATVEPDPAYGADRRRRP